MDDQTLDSLRRIGDPDVDAIVSAYLHQHGAGALGETLAALFRNQGLPNDQPLIKQYKLYLEAGPGVALGDPEIIARGQRLFALFGPEIFLVLGSCSLPLAFAAGNGVQVIHRARRLEDDSLRRLYDTAQMIVNVMQEDGLAPGKLGWRSACKVRLTHALIRQQVQHGCDKPWSASWGTPINQEDMAGTLLSFSVAVLHGLRRIGAQISQADADGYIYAWSAIGRLLGLHEPLLVANERDALQLAEQIGRRQIRHTDEGERLARQLIAAVATLFPLPGYAVSLTHFFMQDTAFGQDVANQLRLPKPGWTRALVAARAWQKRKILRLLAVVPGARCRRSFVARLFVQKMIDCKRPDGVRPFEVPEAHARGWRLRRRRPEVPPFGET